MVSHERDSRDDHRVRRSFQPEMDDTVVGLSPPRREYANGDSNQIVRYVQLDRCRFDVLGDARSNCVYVVFYTETMRLGVHKDIRSDGTLTEIGRSHETPQPSRMPNFVNSTSAYAPYSLKTGLRFRVLPPLYTLRLQFRRFVLFGAFVEVCAYKYLVKRRCSDGDKAN